MPTPTKPYAVLKGEKKSHRTKAELNQRKQAKESLSSKEKIKKRKEVKENKIANKEFNGIMKLLSGIEKNDALYEPVINRYCMIQAECKEIEERREAFGKLIEAFRDQIDGIPKEDRKDFVDELAEIPNNMVKLAGQMNACDKLLQQKRKMLFDIEKENIMTIASTLRSIPKAMKVPTFFSCIKMIANTISLIPIKLYKVDGDTVKEVKDDVSNESKRNYLYISWCCGKPCNEGFWWTGCYSITFSICHCESNFAVTTMIYLISGMVCIHNIAECLTTCYPDNYIVRVLCCIAGHCVTVR